MIRLTSLAIAGLTAFSIPALAQAPGLQRVRGTIEAVNGDMLTVQSRDGKTVQLKTAPDTKYAWVVPSRLSDITQGTFIGTATAGSEGNMKALEVLIFPASMKGTGEGHYSWDMLPDTTIGGMAPDEAPQVKSSMTNGTVSAATSTGHGAPEVKSSMTNATVSNETSTTGGKELTLTYDKGQKVQVQVPPGTPVVALQPASKSVLQTGSKIFVIAAPGNGNTLDAKLAAVGKNGLTPPM